MDQRFEQLLSQMNEGFKRIENSLSYHDGRFNDIEKQLSAKVDTKDFRTLVSVLKAGKVINEHEADHFLIPVS
ncbi:hypothetical protein IPN41_01540 [Candidatus Falkowbacteria bacterium]|nr:MAG: hypothetical protein IPN41_01540 [Candidatus Falkowbacteria bacterium]